MSNPLSPEALKRLLGWRPGGYLRASGGLFGWLLLRAIAQAAMVLVLARLLGAEGYGLFVSVLVVAGFFVPLAGLGLGGLLLRDGAQDPDGLAQRLGIAVSIWWPAALAFTPIAVFATAWAMPSSIPLSAVAALVFSEIVSTSFVELAARVEQSQQRVRVFGGLVAGLAVTRLSGLLVYSILQQPDAVGWMWVYAASSLLYTAAVAWRLLVQYRPVLASRRNWAMVWEGMPFTVGALSLRLQAEFNKPMLAQSSYGDAGNFSVAQRVVDLTSLPLQAMQEAFWPRFYTGTYPHRRMWIIAVALVVLALVGGALLVLVAHWVPLLLGPSFEVTANLLVWLAWLPALQVVRNLMITPLIARGMQANLTWVYLAGGISGIILNTLLVPRFGLTGAIWSLYCSDIIALLILLQYLARYKITRGRSSSACRGS